MPKSSLLVSEKMTLLGNWVFAAANRMWSYESWVALNTVTGVFIRKREETETHTEQHYVMMGGAETGVMQLPT